MRLAGVELHSFRSIGDSPVVLDPLRKCNILVGQNNAGKSNVLKALLKISDKLRDKNVKLTDLDLHDRSPENKVRFKLRFECESPNDDELKKIIGNQAIDFELSWTLGSDPEVTDSSIADIENFGQAQELLEHVEHSHFTKTPSREEIREQMCQLAPKAFRDHFRMAVPKVLLIPEFRQIRKIGVEDQYQFNGENLVARLASFQHPPIEQGNEKERFEEIQKFVLKLLHLRDAKLEVTIDNTITLESNGLRLPLSSYGTGVHELVIMLTAVLSVNNVIICIEEPEIHLHPRLQREFIDFLATETQNQYLISSHSPTLINSKGDVQVFHVKCENGHTVGTPILKSQEVLTAIADLGVKASDILQANCILWVEGPSDRIYLNRWIELLDPNLVEGTHYSIMFYGGKLLSHLSLDEEPDQEKVPSELISLLKINQRAVVVMDSDREKDRQRLGETKRRVRDECKASDSICWVTDGREIENYLPPCVVNATCKKLRGKEIRFSIEKYERFENALKRALKKAHAKPIDYSSNKPKCAHQLAENFEIDAMSDRLRKSVEKVVEGIRKWNI